MLNKLENLEGALMLLYQELRSFSLASFGMQTKGVMVLGVDMEREEHLSDPNSRLVKYRFTPESIDLLQNSGKLPAEIIERMKNSVNNSFSTRVGVELDLDLNDELSQKYFPEIAKATAFTGNGLVHDDEGVFVSIDSLSF